ncbi:MAG: hypothetical protein NTY03_03015 [Candidatus Bathyarchaeota archaeon]|nr:hypothetical protein [Candidatus Bathyarchaeota archaeon]
MHISSTKTSHIALVVAFTLYFVTLYLAFTNPIQPPKPENHTYIKGPVAVTGY